MPMRDSPSSPELVTHCANLLEQGPVWVAAESAIYWVDIKRPAIWRKQWPGGEPSFWTPQFGEGEGYPDGMTVDAAGCLWVAFWDGWCLRRFAPDGTLLARLNVPVQRPTSCAFGGERLDKLFITTARIGLSEAALAEQPLAGALLVASPDVGGLPELPFSG
jgi:D-xylonolactonase